MDTETAPASAGSPLQVAERAEARAEIDRQDAVSLRNWQILAVETNVRPSLVGVMTAATLTVVYFYDVYGTVVLVWFALMLAVSSVRFVFARRICAGRTLLTTPARFATYVASNAVLPATITSFPSLVILHETGFAFAFMLALLLGTFWSGGFLYAPIMAASITYMASQFATFAVITLGVGLTWENVGLLTLFAVGAGTGFTLIREHSKTLRRSVVQRLDIEKQTELIGLLLNEHESQSSDWLWQADAEGRIAGPSDRFADAIGLPVQTLSGRPLWRLLETQAGSEGIATLVNAMTRRDSFRDMVVGSNATAPRWLAISGHPIYDNQRCFCGYRGVMSDVTSAKQAELKITYLAHHDALTGLVNRAHFCQTLDSDLASGRDFALMSIDLDGFKQINDCHGHPVGDAFLTAIGARIKAVADAEAMVARFGGDEFLLRTWRCEPEEIDDLCWRLLTELRRPVVVEQIELTVGASIGVAFAPRDGATQVALLGAVDAALYEAKHNDRGAFMIFAPEMAERIQIRSALIRDLNGAAERGEMALVFQPVLSAATGEITGCEALLRWQHPERGWVSPGDFIPLAEESGEIVTLGSWVIDEACRLAAAWPSNKYVALNISPVQFQGEDLCRRIADALQASGLPPSRLMVEVTESSLVRDEDVALDALTRIRDLGVAIALDDFGTGFSSLAYLRLFPFSKIKIDRTFVRDLTHGSGSYIIIEAVRDIARGFAMTITAEGIETEDQAASLRAIGCDEFQGFLFARPMELKDLVGLDGWTEAA